MSDDKSEHRGWEVNTKWNAHWLDDPTYDTAEDEMEGQHTFFYWLLAASIIALTAASYWPEILRALK